ncbi:uncharacterized protein LOC128220351 isoform X1 [Mya arenaria]|uniref:uncharacterized protein LOC128220351 isoform X1 n=1 Tax=Mya arenaria TaxID=6604 RepID=UPI0022E085C7|nr:uncharacterized protein LOC128220351 isoform X1 [Mya arenaria]
MDLKLTICILCVVSIIGHAEPQLGKDLHAVFGNLALSKSNVLSMVQSTAARSRRAAQVSYSCSFSSVLVRLKKCPGQSELIENNRNLMSGSPSITEIEEWNSTISNICKESECTIKCVVDAIGECYQQDLFFESDPTAKTVGMRALCDPKYDYIDSVLSCYAYSNIDTCFSLLRTAINEAVLKYSRSPSSYTLRVDGCRAFNNYKSCINVTTRNNCTSEKAYFLKNFIKAGVSYGKCGAQTNPFFSDYAGKIQCSNGWRTTPGKTIYLWIGFICCLVWPFSA